MSKSSRLRPVTLAAVALSLALFGVIGCSSADVSDGAGDEEATKVDDATSSSADKIVVNALRR